MTRGDFDATVQSRLSNLSALLPMDVTRLAQRIGDLNTKLEQLHDLASELQLSLGRVEPFTSLDGVAELIVVGRHLSSVPSELDATALGDPIWTEHREGIS